MTCCRNHHDWQYKTTRTEINGGYTSVHEKAEKMINGEITQYDIFTCAKCGKNKKHETK